MGSSKAERAVSALASLAIVALTVWALIAGLGARYGVAAPESLTSIFIGQRSPTPTPPPRRLATGKTSAPKNSAAPRGLKNQAPPISLLPIAPLTGPTPIPAATRTGAGPEAATGASDLPGPGQGAGGFGTGTGGGGAGGDGRGERLAHGPQQIRGRLSGSDLPRELLPPGSEERVAVHLRVGPDGRVHDCEVVEPSHYAQLDALTCRLIQQRYRYRPALDRAGRPAFATVAEAHTWVFEFEQIRR